MGDRKKKKKVGLSGLCDNPFCHQTQPSSTGLCGHCANQMVCKGNVPLLEQEQALLWAHLWDHISARGFISSPNPSGHRRAPQWWKKWRRWDAFLGPFLSSIKFRSCVCACYKNPLARMEKPTQVSKKKKKIVTEGLASSNS